jgi:anti-sigma-K factor RskA
MDTESIHDLSAAYALDALDDDERRSFEDHLAGCERCREEVASFSSTAEVLAYAAGVGSPPSPTLRDRILVAAHAERPNVVPLRPRWVYPVAGVAAVAACVAIGLGIWNVSLNDRLSKAQALQSVPVSGAPGSLVVGSNGSAALVLVRLDRAPAGKTYEAWVIRGKRAPVPSGLFRGGGTTFVPIHGKVRKGSVVAVTVEPAGGSDAPTTKPFVVSQPV